MKKIIALLLCLMLALSVAGCTAKEVAADDKTTAQSDAQADAQGSEASDSEITEPVEIIWQWDVPEEGKQEWAQWCANKCMEENPNIKITIEGGSNSTHYSSIETKIAGGDAPTVFDVSRSVCITYSEAGHLVDLGDVKGMDTFPETKKNGNIDGVQYSVPVDQNAIALFYNKDIFEQYGLSVPNSYSELLSVCKTLLDNGMTPLAAGFGESWYLRLFVCAFTNQICRGSDVGWYGKKMSLETNFSDDPLYQECIQKAWDTHEYWQADPFGTSYDDATSAFATGKVAMILDGSWIVDTIYTTNPDLNYGACAFPASDDFAPKMMVSAGNGFAVYNDEDPNKVEAGKKLIEVIISQESAEKWAELGRGLPILPVAYAMAPAFKDCQAYTGEQLLSSAGLTYFSSEYESIWIDDVQAAFNMDSLDMAAHCEKVDADFASAQ